MTIRLRLDDLRRAWEARDPELVRLVLILAEQEQDVEVRQGRVRRVVMTGNLPEGPEGTPVRAGAPTLDDFFQEMRSPAFRRKPLEVQALERVERIKALESPDAEVPLPDRLRLHEILQGLWEEDTPFSRSCLLEIIARIHLTYGPWRALKRIFKEAEARGDTEIFAALAARFDSAYASSDHRVSSETLAYLRRRAWRRLRRTAITLPACYADAAAEVLAQYPNDTDWPNTWISNHIFFHETKQYDRSRFHLDYNLRYGGNLLKHRAFAELWRRSPRPLFGLLERARSDRVRQFAAESLKTDFRASLREVEPEWVVRLIGVRSEAIDDFVVWILNNVPRFEQAAFRSLGLHDAVLLLFDSASADARAYAARYARTHARDLPVEELIHLVDNGHPDVRTLALDLLQERDPRKEVGLDAWGQLLETIHGHELAGKILRKHYGPRELTPSWFKDRLFSGSLNAFFFVQKALPDVHPPAKLGPDYFRDLIETLETSESRPETQVPIVEFALKELSRFDLNALDPDFLRRLILFPLTRNRACDWIDEGRLKAPTLPLDFWKSLAYHPAWDSDPWLALLRQGDRAWARELSFDESLADRVLGWLRDVRRFTPGDLGFDWLLQMVRRSEPRYHDFAVDVMIRGFVPADFAPKEESTSTAAEPSAAEVDLGGASFLFTGKLATMQRKGAEEKVRQAKGAVASSVNSKLHYLVIGDEGSSLYGHGKKGAKQLKAEEVNAEGGNIKIISETAFLQMLSGTRREVSQDATLTGCERLWQMAIAPGAADLPLARFAIRYLRRHHPDIALAETDRPVDPGAEVPPEFLIFERVRPLFAESRKPLRDFALEIARWEFARWSPSITDILALAELPYSDVRQFVAQALLADDAPEHRRYRINPEVLTPSAVYRFCESADESTRALGMALIERSPTLRVPEEMFRLTESPDRKVRALVIRSLWSLYRDRGITDGWTPYIPPQTTVGAAARKAAATATVSRGTGPPPRPERPPAERRDLVWFLRRILFEIPPARLEASKTEAREVAERLKPLPARKAKLALIETLRDLAIEDADFARMIQPLLREFLISRGKSEHAACLVALTRIEHVHPSLRRTGAEVAS